ncbi:hypothetical protein [Natronococcus wangiae]|uniref:hypothetical protein n=1 Tax=Natronococcus wangiae TaxID=3068275 RepID=UPI00274027DF|nr:hypothetical protein [Natronococcus sp. AD5]
MSSDVHHDDRNFEGELASSAAGQVGIPVDAICVSRGRTRVKRARPEETSRDPDVDPTALEARDLTSFKRVCHPCGSATWRVPWSALEMIENRGESA